ncbi:MAG: DUF1566 domain-containing protein [Aliivibrio sp.]|uniref:Lcl domain-containing protein n=1 Tax=Aliivibrio sp. TaxID=1872443 RepID=UPI001A5CD07A|nr:DUF1566 domain-containing protein [Aliivibrio sp.]
MSKTCNLVLIIPLLSIALAGCGGDDDDDSPASPPGNQIIDNLCGNKINDKNGTNASGPCLKIATDANGKYFTSSPSDAVQAEFVFFHGSMSNDTDTGHSGPTGKFLTLSLSGASAWCHALNNRAFAGISNWRLPTATELNNFNNYRNSKMWSDFGWPTERCYWTSTPSSSLQVGINFFDYSNCIIPASSNEFVSCTAP